MVSCEIRFHAANPTSANSALELIRGQVVALIPTPQDE